MEERVAAYIRVSTQEQKLHGISIDAQEQKLTEYAQKNHLNIVEWYRDEGVSGRKLIKKRPELQRMIKDASAGKFSRIIFIKLDRFFRSVAEYHECMKMLGNVIWTATEEKYDLSTANGRAFVNMKLTIAELEADQTGERIRLVNEYKVKTGQPLYGTQCLPFGYRVEGTAAGSKRIVKQNEEIMDFFLHRVLESKCLYQSYKDTKAQFPDFPLSYDRCRHTVDSTLIYGNMRDNDAYCEPYITKDEFDEIQRIISLHSKNGRNHYTYIFAGLLKCEYCGGNLNGCVYYHKGKEIRGYRCVQYRSGKCDKQIHIQENKAEEELIRTLNASIPGIASEAVEMAPQKKKRNKKKSELENLNAELDRLNYAFTKGRIKIEMYDEMYDDIMKRIDEEKKLQSEDNVSLAIESLPDDWFEMYQSLDNERKRTFWRTIYKSVVVADPAHKRNVKRIKSVVFA